MMELVAALVNSNEDEGDQGWTEDEIRSRTTRRQMSMEEVASHITCMVCLEDLEEGQEVMVVRCPCHRPFHPGCLSRWLGQVGNCPACRGGEVSEGEEVRDVGEVRDGEEVSDLEEASDLEEVSALEEVSDLEELSDLNGEVRNGEEVRDGEEARDGEEVRDVEEVDVDGSAVEIKGWEEEVNDPVDNDEDVMEPKVRATSEETPFTLEPEISEDSSISQISAWEGQVDRIDTLNSVIVQLEAEEVSSESTKMNLSDRPYWRQEWVSNLHLNCFLIVMLLLAFYLLFLLGGRIFGDE